jgi:protein-tyrosine phosphatase
MHRRLFLQMTAAAAATAAAPSWAIDAPTFEVERVAADRLAARWEGFTAPTRLYASSDPAAPPELMRAFNLSRGARSYNIALPASPRPYFAVQGADGALLRAAERVLPLEGGVNFRDLGGYRTTDGRHVRWGLLYRSGVMHALTLADYDYLRHLHIATVCDLRSAQERQAEPTQWAPPDAPNTVSTDYDMSAFMSDPNAADALRNAETARASFAAFYTRMPVLLATQYRDMFQRLIRRETPLAFHCSAGKDRTGMAAAMILSVLDVPRETILADYALSERYYRPDPEQARSYANMPPEIQRVIGGADPELLARALAAIDTQYGSPRAMVQALYGVSDTDIDVLKQAYLE